MIPYKYIDFWKNRRKKINGEERYSVESVPLTIKQNLLFMIGSMCDWCNYTITELKQLPLAELMMIKKDCMNSQEMERKRLQDLQAKNKKG